MTEYRIVELHRRFHIEQKTGKEWHDVRFENVPRFFNSLADARSWVATIKKGVVYHDAEDAPNLAQDERKAEDDTSDGIKPLRWFYERLGTSIRQDHALYLKDKGHCIDCRDRQERFGYKYSDPR
jgi:hypothetical protein